MKVYLAADHAGFEMKNAIGTFLRDTLQHDVVDCGAHTLDPADDYPMILKKAAELLSSDAKQGIQSAAIVFGGSGQGEAVAMNRYKHVRCGIFYGTDHILKADSSGYEYSVLESMRAHDDANALSLACWQLTLPLAQDAVRAWLGARFDLEERHARRIKQLDELG